MSPTKTSASESTRPRKVSTQTRKQKKASSFKQRKIPKALEKPLYIYGAKVDDFFNGDATIKPPVGSESFAHSGSHVTTPQDTVNLTSYFSPTNFVQSQIPISTQVYRGAEPSHVPVPFQYGTDFNIQPEDNTFSLTNNPCHLCGRYDPPSSSTGSLSMDWGVDPYQQLLDLNTPSQYFNPQPILPYVSDASSTFPGNSYADSEITDSSHSTMPPANDATLPFSPFLNYDANSNPHSYY